MNQQPDKLFREKLEGYQKPAPLSAWEKIAAAQPKKNNKGVWLKIAASLLLLASAAYLMWPQYNKEAEQNTLSKKVEQPDTTTTPENSQNQNTPSVDAQRETVAKSEKTPPSKKKVLDTEPHSKELTQEVTIGQEVKDEVEQLALNKTDEIVKPITESLEEVVATSQPAQEQQNITLVFTAHEVNEYLDKKALAQATSDEKKPSTFKKLLKKANDLKSNQDPFGELRQKKNEILALNFKNEKQRGQNK